MSVLQVTSPASPILDWNSSLSLTVSGYSEANAYSVFVNGSSGSVSFHTDKSWSYPFTIISYSGNSLGIESKDILGNHISSTTFNIKVKEPILDSFSYNTLNAPITGKTSSLSKYVKMSLDSLSFVNVTGFTSFTHDFNNNFIFTSPYHDIYFFGVDSLNNHSATGQYSVHYSLNSPTIASFTTPATSRNIHISGTSDLETSGFIFSPSVLSSSGVFASGKSSGYTDWSYDFVLMNPNQTFKIKTLDLFGNSSAESSLDINYSLTDPTVTSPVLGTSSNYNETITGVCDLGSEGILYSTNNTFIPTKVLSASGLFNISGSINDKFNIIVDGEQANITFSPGSKTAANLVSIMNSYFSKQVAQVYAGSKILISGRKIEILSGTSNSTLGFDSGKYNISYEFGLASPSLSTRDSLELNIDGVDYTIIFSKNRTYTEKDIVDAINNAVGRRVSFNGSVIISAEKNIYIKKSFISLGIPKPLYMGFLNNILGNWSLNFDFYATSVSWNFCSIDAFYAISSLITKSLDYEITSPFITSPGTQKILSDNTYTSSSGSTSFFETSSGNFIEDGILITDKVLVLSGSNIGKIGDILNVDTNFLQTSSFLNSFSNGDKISIYSNKDRPILNTNKLPQSYAGLCDPASKYIAYSSSEVSDGNIKLYSSKEYFNFNSLNNKLNLSVNGEKESITFLEGTLTQQNVIDQVNGYFSSPVAFIDSSYFYLKGNFIDIQDCSSLTELDIPSGTYRQSLEVLVPDTYKFQSEDVNFVSLNIDTKDVQFSFINTNADLLVPYTPQFLIDRINTLYSTKKVAFAAPGKVILLGKDNVTVNSEVPKIQLVRYDSGFSNFTNGANVWNKDLKLNAASFTFYVYALDYFYRVSPTNSLQVIFKIDPPTLTTSGQKRDETSGIIYLDTTFNYLTVQGNFNPDGGSVVTLNGTDVYSDYDSWVFTLENLSNGSNLVSLITKDIFNGYSDPFNFNVNFNDPNILSVLDEPVSSLAWNNLAQATPLGPKKITQMLKAIEDTFRPILTGLTTLSDLLKQLRAFITKWLALDFLLALKRALQKFINDVISYLDSIINGAGLFVLNTFPTNNFASKDALSYLQGGFDGFISKVNSSFDDQLDSHRPIMNDSSQVGGMVFVASDSGGVNNLFESMKTLMGIFSKDNPEFGLVPPENLKAVGENHRVSISWTMPLSAISPTGFYIYRSRYPGGNRIKIRTSGADFGVQQSGDLDNYQYDQQTGQILTNYDCVGLLGEVPQIDVPNWSSEAPSDTGETLPALNKMLGQAWWTQALEALRYQAVKEFLFIDGNMTPDETVNLEKNSGIADKITSGVDAAANFFNSVRDFSLVASNSNEKPLVNGNTYYYKVVPGYALTTLTGNSYEVVATPTAPNLQYIKEDLSEQIANKDENNESLVYTLKSAIFNKDTAVYGSSFSEIDIFVDGAKVFPYGVDYKRGIITLNKENQPKHVILANYWGRLVKEATRAFVISKNQGDYTIQKGADSSNAHESNYLEIQVGRGSNLPQVVSKSFSTINTHQRVILVRDFGLTQQNTPETSVILTAEEVASAIRSQTSGINIRVNNKSQIIIEDAMNPDIYKGSYIKIHNTNKTLGFGGGNESLFEPNTESDAGPSCGTPPDWYSIKPADLFPVLNDLLRYIQDTANKLLNSFENAAKSLTDFIDLLIAKVAALAAMAQEIKDLLDRIAKQMLLTAGLYSLYIPYKAGGITYFKNALSNATGKPPSSDYAGGIVMLYSDGATSAAIKLIFGGLAVPKIGVGIISV